MNYIIESLINQLGYSLENLVESNDKYYDYYYRIKDYKLEDATHKDKLTVAQNED